MVLLYFILVGMAWGYTQLFTGRAAFLHLGAFTATIMSANVFFIIMPNQKIVVADLIAGKVRIPRYGKQAKQRSTHNNYLTLPVLFLMLSNHYPLAFGTQYNWIIASLVFLMGVTIRHYFNTRHAKGNPTWTWLATALLFIVIMWLSTVPKILTGERGEGLGRAAAIHHRGSLSEGARHHPRTLFHVPRQGTRLGGHDRAAQGRGAGDRRRDRRACPRNLSAGRTLACDAAGECHGITDDERKLLVAWYETTVQGGTVQ